MGHIVVEDISKSYKVAIRKEGLKASIKQFIKPEYKLIRALENINFEIQPGELVGYIGPNGAGKSTTVKIMSGILVPDSGKCTVNGITPWKKRKEHVKDIGVVFGQRSQLWWDVPVIDSFEILRDIYKIENRMYIKRKNELIERLNLVDIITTPVRQLSLGQRMKCELAASLLHNPSTLFLDEPTIGLDAISKLAVRAFIKDINKAYNTTVILTTHDMDDIEALCNRTIIIGTGKILYDGGIGGLRKMVTDERKISVAFEPFGNAASTGIESSSLGNKSGEVESALSHALQIEGLSMLAYQKGKVVYGYNPDVVNISDVIQELSNRIRIKDILIENASIEEIIGELYEVLEV
ncbi:MAG: ATP-binding cassette domain-containing protein [Vallitaleaceae bacterium]|nr:ATP-binding cassette domain-containing protein [Vallitaleaceae bacterium]